MDGAFDGKIGTITNEFFIKEHGHVYGVICNGGQALKNPETGEIMFENSSIALVRDQVSLLRAQIEVLTVQKMILLHVLQNQTIKVVTEDQAKQIGIA